MGIVERDSGERAGAKRRTLVAALVLTVLVGAVIRTVRASMIHDVTVRPVTVQAPTVARHVDEGCVGSCAPLQTLRPDGSAPTYHLGFVEMRDDGTPREPTQVPSALEHAEGLAASGGVLVVVYVHGWNHDVRPGDTDVACLSETVRAVSLLQAAEGSRSTTRNAMGIFVGWRGRVSRQDWINTPWSFWSRGRVADVVAGGSGVRALGEALAGLKSAHPEHARIVVVGHSLGARIVWGALTSAASGPGVGSLASVADAIVLINPAFTADRIAQPAHERDLPPTLLLASEADGATGIIFPVSLGVSAIWNRFGPGKDPSSAFAAGRLPAQQTHALSLDGELRLDEERFDDGCRYMRAEDLAIANANRGAIPLEELSRFDAFAIEVEGAGAELTLPPLPSRLSASGSEAFYVVRVPGAVIPGHSAFWNTAVADLITRFLNAAVATR